MMVTYNLTGLIGTGIKKAANFIQSKMILTDSEIITRFQDGDDSIFNELVHRHQDFVYNQAYAYLHENEAAKDAVQEVFIKAYHGLAYFQDKRLFQAWLYRICKNHCLNIIRSKKIEDRVQPRFNDIDNTDIPLKLSVKKLISRLDDDYREVIILRYYQSLKYEEMARILNVPISTVKIRLYRAKNKLKELIGK